MTAPSEVTWIHDLPLAGPAYANTAVDPSVQCWAGDGIRCVQKATTAIGLCERHFEQLRADD